MIQKLPNDTPIDSLKYCVLKNKINEIISLLNEISKKEVNSEDEI